MTSPLFPQDFAWGTATASYQIEGAHDADGKGPSIWDDFCRQPGRIGTVYMWAPANGDVACDHYHRWREDVALMRELGVNSYRLSLSWPRLIPDGEGSVNHAGIRFYRELLTALREAGITPWVTLYHWDQPLALLRCGGWCNPESVEWFASYARLAALEFGDLVSHWMTFNEPQCFLGLGLTQGTHAPGYTLPMAEVIRAGHYMLMAHGRAVQELRTGVSGPVQIGYAPVGVVKIPHTNSPADLAAARTAMFEVAPNHVWNNSWWLDPVILGRYPEQGLTHYVGMLPSGWERDLVVMAQPLDFLGSNIYNGQRVEARDNGEPLLMDYPAGSPVSAFKWAVTPEALYWGPRFLHERYALPIVITENGCTSADWIALNGTVPDFQRVDFLHRYLRELRRAISDGIPVTGYFIWSLLDNFEWAEGFKERFGLVYVDFTTLERTPKQSYYFYRDLIRSRGANLR